MSLCGGITLYALLATWHHWYKDDSEFRTTRHQDVGTLIGCILIVLFFLLR